jgi:hypothetical protein
MKRSFETLLKRQADQAKARGRIAERAKLFAKAVGDKKASDPPKQPAALPTDASQEANHPARPWASVRTGEAGLKFYAGPEGNSEIGTQPWAQGLVSTFAGDILHRK